MKSTILFFVFASLLALVHSWIHSSLLNENGEQIMLQPDFVLDRNLIEQSLSANQMINDPSNYKAFIQWMFTQPLFTFDDFDSMVDRNLVPLETAHVAFSRFVSLDSSDPAFYDFVERLGETLKKYFKSFDGFQDEFVNICRIYILHHRDDNAFVAPIFALVEELKGEFSKCLTDEEIGRFILEQGVIPIHSHWYCFNSMIQSEWFTPSDLGTLFAVIQFDFDSSVIENAKTLIVDPESTFKFVQAMGDITSELNELNQWIVSQPWVTSDLIREIIIRSGYNSDEGTLELELIKHEKATFLCATNLNLRKFKSSHILIPSAFGRIIELIKNEANPKQLNKFVAGFELVPGQDSFTERGLIMLIMMSSISHFYPASKFFPEYLNAYGSVDPGDFRQPMFAQLYLCMFDMKNEDLDNFVDFLFACRPFDLQPGEVEIWTEIAEKILRISFSRGQAQVLMAKWSRDTFFADVHEVTDSISLLAAKSLDNSIAELKKAHTLGDQFIEKLPDLGKYEKVFLMLTAPTISKIYFYAFKSLDPSYKFMTSAKFLNRVYNEEIKKASHPISVYYKNICNAYRRKSFRHLHNWQECIDLIETCFSAEEHAADHWMIQDIAKMLLKFSDQNILPLTPGNFEVLRRILAVKNSDLKRDRP